MRGYCVLFQGEATPPFPITASEELASQKSAPIMSHHGPGPPSRTPSPPQCCPNLASSLTAPQIGPTLSPKKGNLATAQWAMQTAVGSVAAAPCSRGLCHQSPLGSCPCGPLPRHAPLSPLTGLAPLHPYAGWHGGPLWPRVPPSHPSPVDCSLLYLAPLLNAVCPGRAALLNDDWLDGGIPSRGCQ